MRIYVKSKDGKGIHFGATLVKVDENKELRWVGHLFVPRLLDGEHIFTIKTLGKNKVRFLHSEKFTGLLSFFGGLNKLTFEGLTDMNRVLKARAEK